jgi:AcrR family transcriptional regulator
MRTRDRIVAQARRLFNEQGYGTITTAALAAHCGIAEGNLWYHFKTRQALLEAISADFAEAIETRLALQPAGDPIADYARLLEAVMQEFRDFRFLYRDQSAYGEHAEVIRAGAPEWLERTFAQLEAHLAELTAAGLLDWPRERLSDLAINATIILRYGLEHFRELGEPTGEGSGAIRRTLLRHLTLFEHRLAPGAAVELHAAIGRIEAEALVA